MGCFEKTCITTYIFVLVTIPLLIIILLILWGDPSIDELQVTDAYLTQFNLINNTTLYYNMKVNITARNPHKNIKVHYLRINAIAWCKDKEFCRVRLAPFDQGEKNITFLEPIVFEGHSVIGLKPRHVAEYNMETSVVVYNDLAVDLDLLIRTEEGGITRRDFDPPVVKCRRLRVPLISNGKAASPFNGAKCSPGYLNDG